MNSNCRIRGWPKLLSLVGVVSLPLVAACGSISSPTGQTSPTQASASPTQALACTMSGPASASWQPPEMMSPSSSAIVSAVVSGDTLTLTFTKGTPAFEITTQPSAHFTAMDGKGGPIDMSGSAGVLIVLRGFRGDMMNYTGMKQMMTSGQVLMEVREIGDYEGVIGWAAGLGRAGCANVALADNTLTLTFIQSGS